MANLERLISTCPGQIMYRSTSVFTLWRDIAVFSTMKSTAICRLHLKREKNRILELIVPISKCQQVVYISGQNTSAFTGYPGKWKCRNILIFWCISSTTKLKQYLESLHIDKDLLLKKEINELFRSISTTISLSSHQFVFLSVCLPVCLSFCLSVCLFVCLSVVWLLALFLTRKHASLYPLLICTLSEFQLIIGQTWKKANDKVLNCVKSVL